MSGMFIAAFEKNRGEIEQTIIELEVLGYSTQEISIITRVSEDTIEATNPEEFSNFPVLGGVIISGPIAAILEFTTFADATPIQIVAEEENMKLILTDLLENLGIPEINARYFSQVALSGGLIVAVPEKDEPDIGELFWSHGAQKITLLENTNTPLKG